MSRLSLASIALLLAPLILLSSPHSATAKADTIRRGWDFAGLPLVNFTTDRGMGYGAYIASFYHGPDGAGDAPYKGSIGGQFYQTTGGYSFHKLLLDFPNIANTGLRFDMTSGYETWDSAWYFGLGNKSPRVEKGDAPERYYEFDSKSIWAVPNMRVPFSGNWSLFSGLVLRSTEITAYENSLLEAENPTGIDGGFLSQVQAGLIFDSRNKEPSATQGIFSEISLRGANIATASDFALWGANMTHRQWVPLTVDGDLVLAFRIGADLHTGEVPFFHQHILGGSQWTEVGGNLTLRGLPNGRHRGNITAYSNTELRWLFSSFKAFTADFDLMMVPFLDLGRVWLWDEDDTPFHIHGSAGNSLRIAYNEVFVIRFDVAGALEEYAESAGSKIIKERRAVLGIYAMINHPF